MPSKTTPTTIEPSSLLNQCIDDQSIQLVSILGIGAYGIVYLGQHIRTQRKYAVKLLTNTKVSCGEIAIHSHLSNHPNILTFEKVIHERDLTFILLEYAPDGDLFASITHPTHGLVGNNNAIRYIFLQILDAVEYCHQRGVAHRDLKPENILMFPHWKVKLADFGLATCQSVSAEFGCGSTFYFSPECQSGMIRNNQRIKGYSTQQNDIWSLGVILINFAAGRNPWKQANMQDATFAAYVQKPRHFFRRILPDISDELDRILGRIFCLDPALRISLPELRLRILKCQSFTRQGHVLSSSSIIHNKINTSNKKHRHHHHQQEQEHRHQLEHQQQEQQHQKMTKPSSTALKWSGSTTETMLAYIQGYTDENTHLTGTPKSRPTPPSTPQTTPSHPSPIITTIPSNAKHYSSPLKPQQKHPKQQKQRLDQQSVNSLIQSLNHSENTLVPCDSLSSTSSLSLSSECSSMLATPDGSKPPNSLLSSAPPPHHHQQQKYPRHQHDSAIDLQFDTCYT